MPRTPRKTSSTDMYHIIIRGIDKNFIFQTLPSKWEMLHLLHLYMESNPVEIYAYCIMDNHMHLLIRAPLKELSCYMQKVTGGFARYYNYKGNHTGYVFQGRFKSECIETENYFWSCFRYIHMNPVKAGLIPSDSFPDYLFSSAAEYMKNPLSSSHLLHSKAMHMLHSRFDSRQSFLRFHQKKDLNIFEDTSEEIEAQQLACITQLLCTFLSDKGLCSNPSVAAAPMLHSASLRREFLQLLTEKLQLSGRKASQLLKLVETSKGDRVK